MTTRSACRMLLVLATSLAATGCIGLAGTAGDAIERRVSQAPSFRIGDAPDDWCVSSSEDGGKSREDRRSLTVTAVDGSANVIVSREPLDAPYDRTSAYADSQGELLRAEFDGYRELESGPSGAWGGRGVEREYTWEPEDGPAVWQLQAYYARDGAGFIATATTRRDEPRARRDQLRSFVHAVRLADPDVRLPAVECA